MLGSPYTITCTTGALLAPNYTFATGTTASFTITKAGSTVTVTCPAGPYTYRAHRQTPCSGLLDEHRLGREAPRSRRTYTDNTNAGTANASATFAGDDNHTGSSNTV